MKTSNAEKKLIKAYFDMLESVHYSKITVTDIIRNAQVSRTTFYRYYVDIFDMHEKISDKLAEAIIKECAGVIGGASAEENYFDEILKIFNTQEKYIVLLSGENGSRYFFESMVKMAHEFIFVTLGHLSESQLFRLRFMTVAMVGVYVRDLLEDRAHNPNYIEICKKLINNDELSGGSYAKQC